MYVYMSVTLRNVYCGPARKLRVGPPTYTVCYSTCVWKLIMENESELEADRARRLARRRMERCRKNASEERREHRRQVDRQKRRVARQQDIDLRRSQRLATSRRCDLPGTTAIASREASMRPTYALVILESGHFEFKPRLGL